MPFTMTKQSFDDLLSLDVYHFNILELSGTSSIVIESEARIDSASRDHNVTDNARSDNS